MAGIRARHATLHQIVGCPPIGRSVLAPRRSAYRRFKVSRVHGRLAVPPRAQCRFLCRNGVGNHPGGVSEHRRTHSFGGYCHATVPLTRSTLSYSRQVHLIHHADDRLCVWTPSHQDVKLLQQQRLLVTHITGWRAYLGTAQHNYAHWTGEITK